jgi:hypothetical protein
MATTIDQATYGKLTAAAGRFVTRLVRDPPQELWHYTTGDGLIKILESGELWSTQVSCVNDSTEFRHAIRASREAFRRRLASDATLSQEHRSLLERIDRELEIDGSETAGYFVACFSENRDDLSQWRAYGSGEGGFALRFQIDSLIDYSNSWEVFLTAVTYDMGFSKRSWTTWSVRRSPCSMMPKPVAATPTKRSGSLRFWRRGELLLPLSRLFSSMGLSGRRKSGG